MGVLKLKEIIWETTLACNKNCTFCGSKEVINKDRPAGVTRDSIALGVASKIAEYPPEELVFSGGEPGLLTTKTIEDIFLLFADTTTRFKVISNGFIFNHPDSVLNKFERIGLSVNTAEEMREVMKDKKYKQWRNRVTFVTNFGKHNIWELQAIADIYGEERRTCGTMMWQVQLTQGNEFLLPPEGIDFLRTKLGSMSYPGIVQADNLRVENVCGSGISSCGILANGDVVPCLSYRCWSKDDLNVQGNVLEQSLQDIWEVGFRDFRFGSCPCCRDCIDFGCKAKKPVVGGGSIVWPVERQQDPWTLPGRQTPIQPWSPTIDPGRVYVYGVINPPIQVVTYSVVSPYTGAGGIPKTWTGGGCGGTTAQPVYGCSAPEGLGEGITITTGSSTNAPVVENNEAEKMVREALKVQEEMRKRQNYNPNDDVMLYSVM